MKNRSKTIITTNLYELISAMHEKHGDNSRHVTETITYLAESGKIRWLMNATSVTNGDWNRGE